LAADTPGHVAGLAYAAQVWLQRHDAPEAWQALASTLAHRAATRPWPFRAVAIVTSGEDLRAALDALLVDGLGDGPARVDRFTGNLLGDASSRDASSRGKLAFIAGGTGAQWPDMGSSLRASHAVFRGAIDDCAAAFARHTSWSLHEELSAAPARSRLDEIEIGAMSTFVVCVALDRLLRSWGVVPDAIAGHSMGEIVGACLAGALTLEDATRVIFSWSDVQRRLARPGQMLVVGLPVEEVSTLVADHRDTVSIAAINSPKSTTLSGGTGALSRIQEHLVGRGVFCRMLRTGGAFHSHEMEPLREPLLAGISALSPRVPSTPFYTTVQAPAGLTPGQPDFDATHWWHNLRNTVDLSGAIDRLGDGGCRVFWELGPHATLASSIAECMEARGREALILGTLRRGEDDVVSVLSSVGTFYLHGGEVDWSAMYGEGERRLASLPGIEHRELPKPRREALVLDALRAARRESWSEMLLPGVVAAAAELMSVAPSAISASSSWIEVGLESLHAVKLRAYLQKQLRLDVPLARLLSSQSIAAFVRDLALDLEHQQVRAEPAAAGGTADATTANEPPLSNGQRGLWFIQELHPDSAAYNMAWPARIEAAIQVDALRRAFVAVMERHAALRTVLIQDREGVRQHNPAAWQHLLHFQQHDVSSWSEAAVQDAVNAAYRRPFDLSNGPTVRVDLFTAGADRHVLLLAVHHLVADAWSLQVLLRDLGALYEAECAGVPASLPRLPWAMKDYVAWQTKLLQSADGTALWQRWRDRLSGELPVLELPTATPRPSRQSFQGSSASFALDPELSRAAKQLARQQGCTMFAVLLSAFYVLLARYTRAGDLLVGTPMAGRSRDELGNMVGYFVNLVPLRVQITQGLRFTELLARVRRTVLEAMDDQDLPFDTLVERLQPERASSRSPLVEAVFEYRQPHYEGELMWLTVSEDSKSRVDLGGLKNVGHYPLRQQEGKFDLQLEMADLPDGIAGVWKYRSDLLDADTIARMTRHLLTLLRGVVNQPEAAVDLLPLMERDERHQVALLGQARTTAEAVRPLHVWFEARVAEHPDAIAVIDGVDQLTYDELNRRANQTARALLERGLVAGQRVGLCVSRSARIVIGQLAILKAGATYVPLDPALPADRLDFYARDANLDVVLTHAALRGRLETSGARLVFIDEVERSGAASSSDNLGLEGRVEAPAYVIYTSGSTGRPKGVVVTHRNVARLLVVTEPQFQFGRGDVWTLFHSYAFDFSVWEIWGALLYGGRLVIVSSEASRSPELLHALLCSEGVTVLNQTPSAFQELSQVDELLGSAGKLSLRLVIFGGEALAPGALKRWVERHGDRSPQLVNMYGITETCVHVTCRPLSAQDVEQPAGSPIGRAIGDLSLHVLDDHMELVPVGVPGELYVGGDGVALGYLHRPGLTAERFVPDPFSSEPGRRLYRTGDLARYSATAGELLYLGRIDSQVKIRGFRIELGEIEHVFRAQPAVRDVVVLAEGGSAGTDYLIAYVVPRRDAVAVSDEVLTSSLMDAVAAAVPAYMVPAAVVMIDRIPLNHNGKVDRKALPSWTHEGRAAQDYEAPRTAVEQRLAAIWADLLPVERVGRTDRFFHIGGHSLLATRLIIRVRQELAVELPILSIFESPMLGDFANRVEQAAEHVAEPSLDRRPGSADAPIVRVDRTAAVPLGLAQQRLWFLDRLDTGNPVYNVPMLFRLVGQLDRAALERSIDAIAARHEVLRTSFPMASGQPIQRIAPPARYELPVVDLTAEAAGTGEARARAIATAEYHRPFDLERGPLWRGQLVILDEACHWLVLCAHHIVLDGWSVNLYLAELKELYRSFLTGTPAALPALETQYVDFSEWQRQWLAGDTLDEQVRYWKAQLEGAPAVLEVPGDRPRPPIQTFRGGLLPFSLSAHQSQRVRGFALQHHATPFMVLLGAFQAVLYRHTGQADLLVGSPIANRPRREVERLLGCFVNNLVLRGRFGEPQSFRELLQATRAATLGAYAHQDVPFEVLVDVLKPQRDLSRNPLFQVMFALQNTPPVSFEAPGLTIESVLPESQIAKFDLSLNLVDDAAAGFTGFFEYNSDIYDRATIEAFSQAFSTLLDSALEHPALPIEDLALLTAAQQRLLLEEWNPRDEAELPPRTIAELFAAQVAARGGARCLVTVMESLSYQEVDQRARRLAGLLIERGVGPEVPVGICMQRTAELPIAMMAVLMAGGACVPMDPKYPRDRLSFMAADAGLSVIIADASSRPLLEGTPGKILEIGALDGPYATAVSSADSMVHRASVDDLAYVIYTSGSTGRPKGVALTHRGVNALLRWSVGVFSDDDLGGVLASTSICFDLSIFELFITWGRGGTVVLVDDLLALQGNPVAASVRLINTVPSAMTELLRMNAVPATTRVVNLAGEPIRQALVDSLYGLGTVRDVYNLYGPTEDTVYSTFARLPANASGPPPIGVAISYGRAYVLDGQMRPMPVGVTGELYLGGQGLARGYLNQPALTAQRFVPCPFGPPGARLYKTGDLARWRRDGQLEFLGRNDGQVKLRGFRIELGEIEEALSRHPRVHEAAVMVRTDGGAGGRLVAYVATGDAASCAASELRRHLHETLPSYMVPASYVIQATLPHTPNGKIDRRALPAPDAERPARESEITTPATATEEHVAAIWRDILGLQELGTEDNFFDLGGHSLLLTRVQVKLDEAYPDRVRLSDLFQHPTVRALSAFLTQGASTATREGEQGRDRASLRKRQQDSRRHKR
jgi:amino acid adenylation domain-containing protein